MHLEDLQSASCTHTHNFNLSRIVRTHTHTQHVPLGMRMPPHMVPNTMQRVIILKRRGGMYPPEANVPSFCCKMETMSEKDTQKNSKKINRTTVQFHTNTSRRHHITNRSRTAEPTDGFLQCSLKHQPFNNVYAARFSEP